MKKIILLVGVSILVFSCMNKAKNKTDNLNEPIKDELEDYEDSNFIDDNTSSFFVYDDMISLFSGNETWLYKKNKSEYFYKEFEHPNNLFENIENKVKYDDISIYYEENGYWKFIGNLSTTRVRSGGENLTSGSKHIYFKNGYRVAYSVNGEDPIEIVFEEKQWEVK